ncbi:hypothetical protein Nepgr_031304 [Nepenthes gracilis]|uniref:Uncharacterized protein n=1 Tax=Nepenthes gracilis TaxID=150966 RepID=A0AAD3Y7E7_NEPGR|nr:hypothetical protein Nepgr_031304 [Nepenthes gracilis]
MCCHAKAILWLLLLVSLWGSPTDYLVGVTGLANGGDQVLAALEEPALAAPSGFVALYRCESEGMRLVLVLPGDAINELFSNFSLVWWVGFEIVTWVLSCRRLHARVGAAFVTSIPICYEVM